MRRLGWDMGTHSWLAVHGAVIDARSQSNRASLGMESSEAVEMLEIRKGSSVTILSNKKR